MGTSDAPRQPSRPPVVPSSHESDLWSAYRDEWQAYADEWQAYWRVQGELQLPGFLKSGWSTYLVEVLANRDAWRGHWEVLGQHWRFFPEVDADRQQLLDKCRRLVTSIERGEYPFSEIELSIADLEWLLETQDDGKGPIDWADEKQRGRYGLDLRGADLRGLDLRSLPLTRMRGGLTADEFYFASAEQEDWAAVRLEHADLRGAHLEGALLRDARMERAFCWDIHLEGADLEGARLDDADLSGAYLEGANLQGASLERCVLESAHLERADLRGAHLQESTLRDACLAGSLLNSARFESADLQSAHLGGRRLPDDDAKRIGMWCPDFKAVQPPADLRRAFFNGSTYLENVFHGIFLGDKSFGYVPVADVTWGGVNLAVVSLPAPEKLGDEREARRKRTPDGKRKSYATRLAEFEAVVRANRQLATALRDQGQDERANRYAYHAEVMQRRVFLRQAFAPSGPPILSRARGILAHRQGMWPLRLLRELALAPFVLVSRFRPRRRMSRLAALLLSAAVDMLAGHGYRPWRTFGWYLVVVLGCAEILYEIGQRYALGLSPLAAVVMSLTSFHGRGFLPTPTVPLDHPLTVVAAAEAVVGLVIEISVIATFTQRYFNSK